MHRKILFTSLLILLIGYFFVASVDHAFASENAVEQFKNSLKKTGEGAGYPVNQQTGGNFPAFVGKIIGYALSFLGVIFLCLIIYSGYIWMMARGNEQAIEKAKDILTSAIIGLVIVLAAYAIVYAFNTYVGSNLIQAEE